MRVGSGGGDPLRHLHLRRLMIHDRTAANNRLHFIHPSTLHARFESEAGFTRVRYRHGEQRRGNHRMPGIGCRSCGVLFG